MPTDPSAGIGLSTSATTQPARRTPGRRNAGGWKQLPKQTKHFPCGALIGRLQCRTEGLATTRPRAGLAQIASCARPKLTYAVNSVGLAEDGGEAEVADLDLTLVTIDEDVVALEVPVDDGWIVAV